MTTTTLPRRPLAPWMSAVAITLMLIGILVASGARITWDVRSVTVHPQQVAPEIPAASIERAEKLAAARLELTALRDVVRQVPSIRASMYDHMQLLAAVGAGHVPVETLDRDDDAQLQRAINAGHVPDRADNPLD